MGLFQQSQEVNYYVVYIQD